MRPILLKAAIALAAIIVAVMPASASLLIQIDKVSQRMTVTVDELLARARAKLRRVAPAEAAAAVDERGALLVDTRPEWQRRQEGEIPGALLIERNHLEWRLDPASEARVPEAVDHDVEVIVVCSEGYASSLAAASLQELGLHRATDLVGGYRAWVATVARETR